MQKVGLTAPSWPTSSHKGAPIAPQRLGCHGDVVVCCQLDSLLSRLGR